MDAILSYLDNMFAQLPKSPEVIRAKNELSQMMEDKYNQLISEGKSENEAVGQVISEFGNLQELAQDLGIAANVERMTEKADTIELTRSDVDQILSDKKRNARRISIGIGMVLLGVIALLFVLALGDGFLIPPEKIAQLPENLFNIVGVSSLLLLIAISVGFFVRAGVSEENYEYLEKKYILLDHSTKHALIQEQRQHTDIFVRQIVTGVTLVMLGIISVIAFPLLLPEIEWITLLSVCILLAFIAIGTAFFILAGMLEETYKQLLNHEKPNAYDGEEKSRIGGVLGVFIGYYWVLVTIAYFLWSWLAKDWKTSWIIWPIAALAYGFIVSLAKVISRKKE